MAFRLAALDETWPLKSPSRIVDSVPGGKMVRHVAAAAPEGAPTLTFTWSRPYGISCNTSSPATPHTATRRIRGRYGSNHGQRWTWVPPSDAGTSGARWLNHHPATAI